MSNVINVFRNMYDDYLYNLRLENLIDDYIEEYEPDTFHIIFNAINNTFNAYLDDQYLFMEFGTHLSQTSLETIMGMYEAFNDQFVMEFKQYVNINKLKILIMKNMKFINHIYNRIFDQYEPIYLPFY